MAAYDENNRGKMKLQVSIVMVVLGLNCCLTSGFMDIEELKNVYYGLDILTDPVIMNKEETPLGTVQVTSKYGQPYQCTFPDLTLEDRRKEEEEKLAVETGIAEMLRPMATKDCLFKTKDWWSYEFCYGKYIRQFHMEEGVIKGNIIYLGNYEEDFDWANNTAREDRLRSKATISRYHSQTYTEGTKCDLTGQPRRAEVRFLCEENSEDYLSRVDEGATCMYTVTIMTSRICRHPDLKAPARRRPVPITCNPLLTEGEFHDYMEEIEEQKLQKEKDSILKSAAALKYGDPNAKFGMSDLDKALEEAMSSMAKDLLTKPVEQIIPKQQPSQTPMTREQFEGKFGKEGGLYDLYLRGIEIAQKRQAKVLQRIAARQAKNEGQGTAAEADEDDELMKEFDEEIKQIKATFEKSSSKVTALQNKLRLQKSWEEEIENVIKEAENELGVKVDRSMVSGLSNTLDKLVNKLQDTHEQLTSMDTELHRLNEKAAATEPEVKDTTDDSWTNSLKDDDDNDEDDNDDDDDEEMDENVKMQKDLDLHFQEEAKQLELESAAAEAESEGLLSGLESKILPPPKTEFGSGGLQQGGEGGEEQGSFMDEAGVTEEGVTEEGAGAGGGTGAAAAAGGAVPEAPKMTLTITKKKDENEVPERVQKLLEEKMRKEMEKKEEGDDTKIDTDHSFHHKDKSVHIFQEEDEDGKTNKFIMVVGLNSFNDDENTESVKQSQLEDSYGFKFTGRKQKKIAPAS